LANSALVTFLAGEKMPDEVPSTTFISDSLSTAPSHFVPKVS